RTESIPARNQPIMFWPMSVALQHRPTTIEAASGEILLAGAEVQPSNVTPFHANVDIAVDLQHELPFAGLRKMLSRECIHVRVGTVVGKFDALRFDRVLNGKGSTSHLVDHLPFRTKSLWISGTKIAPELLISLPSRPFCRRPCAGLFGEGEWRRQQPGGGAQHARPEDVASLHHSARRRLVELLWGAPPLQARGRFLGEDDARPRLIPSCPPRPVVGIAKE